MTLHKAKTTARSGRTTVALPDRELHWALRRAALERRVPLQTLVTRVLRDWLADQGEPAPNTEGNR